MRVLLNFFKLHGGEKKKTLLLKFFTFLETLDNWVLVRVVSNFL